LLGGGAFKQPRDPWQSLSDEALVKTKKGGSKLLQLPYHNAEAFVMLAHFETSWR
jgi:hypothetical protein